MSYRFVVATDERVVSESAFEDLDAAERAFEGFGVLEAMGVVYEDGNKGVAVVVFEGDEPLMAHGFMSNWEHSDGMEWLNMAAPFKEVVWKAWED